MEINTKFNAYNPVTTPGQVDSGVSPNHVSQDQLEKTGQKVANAILTSLVDLISDNLGITNASRTESSSQTDSTSLRSMLPLPENVEITENLDKLLALFQLEYSAVRLNSIKARIASLQQQIQARCHSQIASLRASVLALKAHDLLDKVNFLKNSLPAHPWLRNQLVSHLVSDSLASIITEAALMNGGFTGSLDDLIDLKHDIAETLRHAMRGRPFERPLAHNLFLRMKLSFMCRGLFGGSTVKAMKAIKNVLKFNDLCFKQTLRTHFAASLLVGLAAGSTVKDALLNIELAQLKKMLQSLEQDLSEKQEAFLDLMNMIQSNMAVLENLLTDESHIQNDLDNSLGNTFA